MSVTESGAHIVGDTISHLDGMSLSELSVSSRGNEFSGRSCEMIIREPNFFPVFFFCVFNFFKN